MAFSLGLDVHSTLDCRRLLAVFTRVPKVCCSSFGQNRTALNTKYRWLIANGKREQAIEILCKLRGDVSPTDAVIKDEIEQLDAVVESAYYKRNNLLNIALAGRYSGKLHLGRRAVMGFALQWIQQWTGILAIAAWAGTLVSRGKNRINYWTIS